MKNEIYNKLLEYQQNYPLLTFQNNGYEYLSKEIQDNHKDQIKEIEELLKTKIEGFSHFNNFKIKSNIILVRCQYDYSKHLENCKTSFIGVGYFPLEDFKD